MGGGRSSIVRKLTDTVESVSDKEIAAQYAVLEGAGIIIPEADARGITLAQMQQLFAFATVKCKEEKWSPNATMKHEFSERSEKTNASARDSLNSNACKGNGNSNSRSVGLMSGLRRSNANQKYLSVADIDLYTIVENVVQPATALRNCSFVEFIAIDPDEQVPTWFVSHWWGEKFNRFLNCLEEFSSRHALTYDTPFWICAYAIRQNQLSSEIGLGDPMDEPFAKAIASDKVEGTVTILDEKLVTYKRAWCCFEATITLCLKKRLDLVTSLPTGTFMIADTLGVPRGDGDAATQEAKDQLFPLEVTEEGMRVTIELSTTSQPVDKNRILNCIALENVSLDAPPLYHKKYDYYNDQLRSKFATMFLRIATANGDADGVQKALCASPSSVLAWQNAQGQTQLEIAKALSQDHPDDQSRKDIVSFMEQAAQKIAVDLSTPRTPCGSFQSRVSFGTVTPILVSSRSESPDSISTVSSHTSLSRFVSRRLREGSVLATSRRSIGHPFAVTHDQGYDESEGGPNQKDTRFTFPRCRTVHLDSLSAPMVQATMDGSNSLPILPVQMSKPNRQAASTSFGNLVKRRKSLPPMRRTSLDMLAEEGEMTSFSTRTQHTFPPLTSPNMSPSTTPMTRLALLKGFATERPTSDTLEVIAVTPPSPLSRDSSTSTLNPHDASCLAPVEGRLDIKHVVDLLRLPTARAQVRESCCRALGAFASIGVEFQNTVVSFGGLDAIIKSMDLHEDSQDFQVEACCALFNVIFDNDHNSKVAAAAGAAAAVNSAMENHPDSICLRKEARRVLGELTLAGR